MTAVRKSANIQGGLDSFPRPASSLGRSGFSVPPELLQHTVGGVLAFASDLVIWGPASAPCLRCRRMIKPLPSGADFGLPNSAKSDGLRNRRPFQVVKIKAVRPHENGVVN
jgi:hypothetical protein